MKGFYVRPIAFVFVLVLAALFSGCASGQATSEIPLTSSPSSVPAGVNELGGSSPTTTLQDKAIVVRFVGGTVAPEPTRRKYEKGETVSIVATSDVADEVHVHGYDKTLPLEPNVTASVQFVAEISGVFEVELEQSGKRLFEIEIGA